MMSKFTWGALFLLVDALVKIVSVAGITQKHVCPGNSFAAFQNKKLDNSNANVSLYLNSEKDTLLATWSMQNSIVHSDMLNVSLDSNGTIWIHNVHAWDEGTYVVMSATDNWSSIDAVQIIVMDPPTEDCRPNIMRFPNFLIADRPYDNVCGKPVQALLWKDSDGVFITGDEVLQLIPGMKAGPYYACIDGPALTCVRNVAPQDYCSTYIIEETKSPLEGDTPVASSSEVKSMRTILLVVVGILLVI